MAEFVLPALEHELIHVSALPLQPFQFGAFEGKRRVASFSFRYDDTLQRLQAAEPIPDWLLPLIEKVEAMAGPRRNCAGSLHPILRQRMYRLAPRQAAFRPDLRPLAWIAVQVPFSARGWRKWQRYTPEAAPRSLYMMLGRSRRIWEYSIPAVEAPRYSITFRTMADQTA